MSEHKAIFKSASVISGFTLLSRVTGFVRDVLIAHLFGTGIAAQAFFVAFKIPNAFRDFLGEGAGNAAFVPVFCEYLEKRSKADFLKLVNSLLQVVVLVSVVLTAAGILFSPAVIRLVAPGFSDSLEKFDLAVTLNRWLFPYLILIAFSAYLMSVSNALKSFAMPASSSIANNLVLIAGIYGIMRVPLAEPVYALCGVVLLGGIAQALVQVPALRRAGIDFKKGGVYPRIWEEPAIRKVGRLIFPRLLGTGIYQANVFIDTIFASLAFFVGEGAVAAVYYANRIIQLPFAIFGVALSNAALPALSASSAQQDMERFRKTLLFCLKAVFLGIVPVTAGILALSSPLVRVIFERGSFDPYSTMITARAVFFFALGLVSYVGVRFLSHGFYALQDTRTPVKTAGLCLCLSIALNALLIFVFRLGITGLALASSVSATVNFFLLYRAMQRRVGLCFTPEFTGLALKSMAASALMAGLVFWVWRQWCAAAPTFLKMFFVAVLGGASYIGLLLVWQAGEVKELLAWLRKKR